MPVYNSPCPWVPLSSYNWLPYFSKHNPPPVGCSNLPWNPVVYCLDAAFLGITIWVGLDLNVRIFFWFKKRSSLYFWSMLVSTWGSLLFAIAVLLVHFTTQSILATVFLNVSWVAMVSGFSFVLYSRLYLLKPSKKQLNVVLAGIIVNAILFHGPVIISSVISNIHSSAAVIQTYDIASFTEVAFAVQETVLAGIYIYLFLQFTADSKADPDAKATLRLLISAECVILAADIVLNVLLYMKLYLPRVMIQALVSVIKLQIEFAILNSLIEFAQKKSQRLASSGWYTSSGLYTQVETPISPTSSLTLQTKRNTMEKSISTLSQPGSSRVQQNAVFHTREPAPSVAEMLNKDPEE